MTPEIHEDISRCAQCKTGGDTLMMCSGCKSVAYCSKECQREAWGNHKARCTLAATKPTAPSPSPQKETPEADDHIIRLITGPLLHDEKVMMEILGLCVVALDLPNHPERVGTHTVEMHCEVEGGDMRWAKAFIRAITTHQEPPPKPTAKMSKLFQLREIIVRKNSELPKEEDEAFERFPSTMAPPDWSQVEGIVRYMFTTPNGSHQIGCMFAYTPLVKMLGDWMRQLPDHNAEMYARETNLRFINEPERKAKFSIMCEW